MTESIHSSTLLLNEPGLRWLFATLSLQHISQSQQAPSGVRRVTLVSRVFGDTWAACPTLLRGICLGAEGQLFVTEVDFPLTFSFLVVEVEDCRHRFGVSAMMSSIPSRSGSIHLRSPGLCWAPFQCFPVAISMHDCYIISLCILSGGGGWQVRGVDVEEVLRRIPVVRHSWGVVLQPVLFVTGGKGEDEIQNRRQKVVNKGALCSCRGGLTFKFDKNFTDS